MRAKRATIITSAIFELWKLFSSGNAELSFEDLPIHLKFSFLQEIFQKFVMVVIFLDSMLVINESNSSLLEIDGMMEKVRKESLVKIISTLGLLG